MGMKENEYQNAIREIVFYFFAAPAIILIGMFAIGTIIDSFLNKSGTFAQIFIYVGGIPAIAAYYYDRFFGFKRRAKKEFDEK